MNVKILADGASFEEMIEVAPVVSGFTTNPSLMARAGVHNYEDFAQGVLKIAAGKPVSLEVLHGDNPSKMRDEAKYIATWGPNVFVKIPVYLTSGIYTTDVIRHLVREGIKVNVTAILERVQVEEVVSVLSPNVPSCISIFAGRLADVGRDPVPLMAAMAAYVQRSKSALIWASARELYNVVQAEACKVPYITLSTALIRKLPLLGKDPLLHSLDTVLEFAHDARLVGAA